MKMVGVAHEEARDGVRWRQMIHCGDLLKVVGEKGERRSKRRTWTESENSLDGTCWTDITRQRQSTLSAGLDSEATLWVTCSCSFWDTHQTDLPDIPQWLGHIIYLVVEHQQSRWVEAGTLL